VTVDGREVLTRDFATRVRFQRWQLVNQYVQTALNQQFFAGNPNLEAQIAQTLQSIEFQLQPALIGRSTLDQIVNEMLISDEAARRDITVSDEELEQALAELFGYFESGTPTPSPTVALSPTSTLSALQHTFVTAAPTTTPTALGTSAAPSTPTSQATEEAEAGAEEPTATAGLPTLTPTVITEETYQESYGNILAQLAEIEFTEEDYRVLIRAQLLADKLFAEMTDDVPFEAEQVWVRQIVLAEESEALAALERAESGEDWAELAAELSTDSLSASQGGDLGWINAHLLFGQFDDEFYDTAFAADLGEIIGPFETDQGWHVVQVLGHEVRQYTADERSQIQAVIFQDWLAKAAEAADVVIVDDWVSRVPRNPDIPPGLRVQTQNPVISP
jgi:parvulin-like peptidyl-prolyl isomerase